MKENQKRWSRAELLKLLAMLGVIIAAVAFATIAWFAAQTSVTGSGMGVSIGTDAYQIVPVAGSDSIYQDYYNYIDQYTSDALVWKMTDESNMENYSDATGISPGSFGTISFYVHPRDEEIHLDLSFDIVGYKYQEETVTAAAGNDESSTETTTQEPVRTMTEASAELQGYLAGHIFLFQNRTDTYDKPEGEEGRKLVSSVYSDPILSGADLTKVISNRTFSRAYQDTVVNIYWVWPKTLSTLVDATDNTNVTISPFCEGTHRTAIENNIITYPGYYFYQYQNSGTPLTVNTIVTNYDVYGELFDRVDNQIGTKVSFVTLKMTSHESAQAPTEQSTAATTTPS